MTAWGSGSRANACAASRLRNCTNAAVTILGMTFKEDVPDIRNSKVIDIVRELERFGIRTQVHDPLALRRGDEARIRRHADAARGACSPPTPSSWRCRTATIWTRAGR